MSRTLRIAFAVLALGAFSAAAFAADPSAPAAGGDPVVARVNGQEIHRSDVERELRQMGPQAEQMPIQMLYPQLLNKMIATKLVSSKGYAENLQNDPQVKAEMKDAEAQLVAQQYVRKTIQPKITEAKIKEKYDELAAKFKPEDVVHARHILLPTEAEAEDVIKQLKAGADFAKLAQEKSHDTGSAKEGGDLGYFTRSVMVKPFADTAFSMKVGEISATPVKTDFGYHVIQVLDKRKSSPPPLSEVHDKIANELGQEMTDELLKSMEKSAKIEKFNPDGTPMKTAASAPAAK